MVNYLIRSNRHLVQYVATNLLPKKYVFWSMSWLPEGADALLVDAKLILRYNCHISKETAYRRRKGGHATVKYLRVGRLCLLLATKGDSPFFQREAWKDIRDSPLHIAG